MLQGNEVLATLTQEDTLRVRRAICFVEAIEINPTAFSATETREALMAKYQTLFDVLSQHGLADGSDTGVDIVAGVIFRPG